MTRIACDLSALDDDERARYAHLSQTLRAVTEEIQELKDGYAFRYRTEDTTWMTVAEYVSLERRCCPFFAFELKLEPEDGDVWLHLRGAEGVKEFLASQLGRS